MSTSPRRQSTVGRDSDGKRQTSTAPAPTSAPTTPAPTTPAPTTPNPSTPNVVGFFNEIKVLFPWIEQLGFTPEWFQELAATSASGEQVLAQLRQAPQYKQRFPGLWRTDGSLRMNEAQYLATESNYRQLLRQYGFNENDYASPVSLVGFFEGEIDPNELKDRLDVYKQVQDGGQSTRDAFYVYAGLNVTNDDLFEAIVDPAAGQRLTDEYNRRIASGQFDYTTWITRATEVGLERVAQTLGDLSKTGAVTGDVVQTILRTDPGFARQIMDALYTGGSGQVNQAQPLDLQELLSAFEYAAIGAAASNSGLELPTLERVAEIRAAGVDRARASQAYLEYGQNRGIYSGAIGRSRGDRFTQGQFEQAAFLNDAQQASDLRSAMAAEEAAGNARSAFRFDQDRTGRLFQRGLRPV
jgi:hypothetical protein